VIAAYAPCGGGVAVELGEPSGSEFVCEGGEHAWFLSSISCIGVIRVD